MLPVLLPWLLACPALLPLCEPDPELSDLDRFPPEAVARCARMQGDDYLRALQGRWLNEPRRRAELDEAAAETRRMRACWDLLENAWQEHRGEEWRCGQLAELRRLLGGAAYRAGWMPAPVPLWRFGDVSDTPYREPAPPMPPPGGSP